MSENQEQKHTQPDPVTELRFALAEADAVDPPSGLRDRVMANAMSARTPGRSVPAAADIDGTEVFRRTVERLDALLGALEPDDWKQPAIRDLDVQGLVGHLGAVEESFVRALESGADPLGPDGHVPLTADAAHRQSGRAPADTHRAWFEQATASLAAVGRADSDVVVPFYGVALPLEWMLIVRAFEMWVHDEDIRRATNRPLDAIDPERLARMASLVATLLPVGMARVDRASARAARLVLTGPGGGTWNVNLDGSDDVRAHDALMVVDATQFCRVVGARANLSSSGAIVTGDLDVARDVFAGAAALALD
jgi:uncharacterized protein (TIGR03083 family)